MIVLKCNPTISYVNVQSALIDQSQYYFSTGKTYDVASAIAEYRQEPACGYDLQYRFFYKNLDSSANVPTLTPPFSITPNY